MPLRPLSSFVPLALAVLVLAGCTSTVRGAASPRGASTTGGAAATPVDPYAPVPAYEANEIDWFDCTSDIDAAELATDDRKITFECGTLAVPLDYANPDDALLTLVMVRAHLAGTQQERKPLVMNPGGPGGSGVQAAIALAYELPIALLEEFDLIGPDPRGVGESSPVKCVDDSQRDTLAANDPTPDTDDERSAFVRNGIQFAKGCAANYPGLEFINTVATARDLDQLRESLGQDKLDYLGYSYGTELGAAYAMLYPDRVGRFVLDGAVDPTTEDVASADEQLAGFESTFDRFVADCISRGTECPISADPKGKTLELIASSDSSPVPNPGDDRVATEGIVLTAIASALYQEESWPDLATAVATGLGGDATGLFGLADIYNGRFSIDDQVYWSNMVDANSTISCNDSDEPLKTRAQAQADGQAASDELAQKYPVYGRSFGWGAIGCVGWDQRRHPTPEIKSPATGPILVIGTKNDPATPYSGAVNLAAALGPQTGLLTYEGDGHTAFPSSDCINNVVLGYLKEGTVPSPNPTCPAQ